MDVAFFNINKEKQTKNSLTWWHILATVVITVVVIAVGYVACVKAGLIQAPGTDCCGGVLSVDLDFDFEGSKKNK